MYYITENKSVISPDAVHKLLLPTYWGKNRSLETVAKSMEHSLCIGALSGEELVGFARVITDYATTFYLCDVVVDENHRGKGIGKMLVRHVVEDARFKDLRGILLTHDAHGLYAPFGFETIENRYMGFNAI